MKVKEILEGCSEWSCAEGFDALRPEVTVLLPTFRRAKSGLFEKAVQSVLNQDFRNWELILIDDGSTDGTADLIAHFMRNDSRIGCIRHRYNVGLPAISEYEGYEKSRGEYIAFIFDDNVWERDYLSQTINYMVRENAKATFGRVRSYYGGGGEDEFIELGNSAIGAGLHTLPYTNLIANGGVILAREVIETIGLYDPHIALTRLCDWNFWKRISRRYEFCETGILAGIETGAMQKDSLGNSYQMSSWIAAEREAVVSDFELLPKNYLDAEINSVSVHNTLAYLDWIKSTYQEYGKKKWYKPEKMPVASEEPVLRVLVLVASYDASFELAFLHLRESFPAFFIRYGSIETPIQELAQADAVVFVRNMVAFTNHQEVCEKFGIPCYLYIDDNFIELAKENKQDNVLQLFRFGLEEGRASRYAGVFVSTKNLQSYFNKNGINRNLYCLEPCVGRIIRTTSQIEQNTAVFAYMGGPARDMTFVQTVMPALLKLSSEFHIRLLVPDRVKLTYYEREKSLEIVRIPFNLSLELTLERYSKHHPAVLLHCGAKIKNNRYKTRNALINAVRVGAVLVASNIPPFNDSTQKGESWLCAGNTSQEWFETLHKLISADELRLKIFQNALQYCQAKYRQDKAVHVMREAFQGIQSASYSQIMQRIDQVIFDIVYVKTMDKDPYRDYPQIVSAETLASSAAVPSLPAASLPAHSLVAGKPSRSLTEVPLCFTGGIAKNRKYRIRCNVDPFSELGVCFSAYGEPRGSVHIKIRSQSGEQRECTLNLAEYVHDNWTYLSFDPIRNAGNKVFQVAFRFEYEAGSARVGVFENNDKRSFLYRLTNKFGHPIPVMDVLFADCR